MQVAAVAVIAVVVALGGLALSLSPGPGHGAATRHRRLDQGAPAASLVVVAAAVAAVALATCAAATVRDAGLLPRLARDGASVTLRGATTSSPRPVRADPARPWTLHQHRWVVVVAATHVAGRGRRSGVHASVLVVGSGAWGRLQRGQPVRVEGRLGSSEPGDEVVAVLSASGPPVVDGRPTRGVAVLMRLREGLARAAEPLPPDERGLLPGLVDGDTRALPPDLATALRTTGLTHLTAVSGGNTALVTGAALAGATVLGLARWARVVLAGGALGAFTALAGGDPSVLRAAGMGALALLALATSRRGTGVPALAATVVVLLVADPWLSRSAGFVLSVVATGSILVLARPWAAALAVALPRWLASAVAVPLAAQCACAPVLVLLAPQVSLVAVPANFVADPVVGPTTIVGLAATAVAPFSPGVASLLARVAGAGAWWIAQVARRGASVPAAVVPWPTGWIGALALAGITLALGLLPALVQRLRR